MRDAAVFEITGIDLAGPLWLKGGQKAWICLFTCAVYRAIHLELVTTLSTEGFLEAFRRFVARRGRPAIIFSDNSTNFAGASNLLGDLNWDEINKHASVRKIDWRFNPPSAAWWGGWRERLIRSIKDILRKTLGRASLNEEEMYTTLCDCESIINSRPITYLSEDPDQLTPFTPAMFMQDVQEIGLPDLDQIDEKRMKARLRRRQQLRTALRTRFRSEYLGQLSRASRQHHGKTEISVGDIVIVGNDIRKRVDWLLGRITQVIPGTDGEIRVVRVKTEKGELVRPVQRLYPLEVSTPNAMEMPNRTLENDQDNNEDMAPVEEPLDVHEENVETRTRRGRQVRPLKRLNL